MPPTLVLLSYSPWSERVRWVFDHHGLAYRRIKHEPVIGELRLRRIVGRDHRPATVPALRDGDLVLTDSWAIARHADRLGAGPRLLPEERLAEIERWNAICEAAMRAGRGLVVAGLLADDDALDETMPPAAPTWLRRLARPISRRGTRWFARKYGIDLADPGAHEAGLRAGLDALRAGLAGGKATLLGEFSYADIVAASMLQGVQPVADAHLRLGPGTRRAWTQPGLARDYADLVAWRDGLYRDHRPRRPA